MAHTPKHRSNQPSKTNSSKKKSGPGLSKLTVNVKGELSKKVIVESSIPELVPKFIFDKTNSKETIVKKLRELRLSPGDFYYAKFSVFSPNGEQVLKNIMVYDAVKYKGSGHF